MKRFKDRQEAGEELAERLSHYANRDDVTVLALPRGGVSVAYEVAVALGAPLDVLLVRKLGVPGHEELAMGAVASGGAPSAIGGGVRVLNPGIVATLQLTPEMIEEVSELEVRELERREARYRGDRPPLRAKDRTVILVDDGVATGATVRAALRALRQLEPAHLVVAVPTAAGDSCAALECQTDEVVCLATPEPYIAVGAWYRDFPQVSDDEVVRLLARAAERWDAHRRTEVPS